MKIKYWLMPVMSAGIFCEAPPVMAQSEVTLYGVLDEYIGYQSARVHGKSTSTTLLGNNGQLTSRLGMRGSEDLGDGYRATFDIESGFDPGTGKQQNAYRLYDRQTWMGIASPYGEVRFGRQNSPMFLMSGNMDAFGAATFGSGYNDFANWLSRVDNDISYLSPKIHNTQVELHYSVGGVPGSLAGNAVYQAGVQTTQGPVYFATAYVNAANSTNTVRVQEFMAGGNVDYGHGKVYLGFFRANDIISATTGNALSNPAGKYDPTVGPVGNTAGNYHNTYSISADYRISPALSVGAGFSFIQDDSHLHNNASQTSAIVNYSFSKRTRVYGVLSYLDNRHTASFKMTDASVTAGSFLTPDAGKNEKGAQIGIVHMF